MSAIEGYVTRSDLRRAAGENLYYVRLAFEPVYPDVRDVLKERLLELGVGSAHVYELIGGYDLLLRIWCRGDIRGLIESLALADMRRADFMAVRRIHEHWAASHPISDAPSLHDLADLFASGHDDDVLERQIEAGVIAPITRRTGVKFFVSISASIGVSSSINFDEVLFRHVTRILRNADDLVSDLSVYGGDGFARLFLSGRFATEDYFEFGDRVLFPLNDEYMRDLFRARTETALGARPDPVIAIERFEPRNVAAIQPRPPESPVSLRDLLVRGESQDVEVKASAFLNFDRFVAAKEPDWTRLRSEFVKAVCGMLNRLGPEVGAVIVGAVETARYRRWLDSRAERLPEIGSFTIVGVEEDNPSGDWDLYQRRLSDALRHAIDPSPLPYITMSLEALVTPEAAERKLLRLEITPSGMPFYDRGSDTLWVRTGTQVQALHGPQRDAYARRMATPR